MVTNDGQPVADPLAKVSSQQSATGREDRDTTPSTAILTPSTNSAHVLPPAVDGSSDPLARHFEELPPHKRALAATSGENKILGERKEEVSEITPRRRHKVHIRHTSEGWVEIDEALEQAEKEQKERDATQSAAAAENAEASEVHDVPAKKQDEEKPHKVYGPETSTPTSWNEYACAQDSFDVRIPARVPVSMNC